MTNSIFIFSTYGPFCHAGTHIKELKDSSPSFSLGKSKIPMVEQCRYLGTTISIKNSDLIRSQTANEKNVCQC